MKYNKPFLTISQQADLLIQRGLISDKALLVSELESINYYRLSGYLYPFRTVDNRFIEGTTIEIVLNRYIFDRRLRMHTLDALQRIEVCLKTHITYFLAEQYGAFGYTKKENFLENKSGDVSNLMSKIKSEISRSKETFVDHFFNKYGDLHDALPIWMAVEVMTFGTCLSLFRLCKPNIQKQIAEKFGVQDKVFLNWMVCLNALRNICAHHSRLWNSVLGYQPLIPSIKKNPNWHQPVEINPERVFSLLSIIAYLLDFIAPKSSWKNRFKFLISEFPDIPKESMGMKPNWEKMFMWQETK